MCQVETEDQRGWALAWGELKLLALKILIYFVMLFLKGIFKPYIFDYKLVFNFSIFHFEIT